MQIPVHFYSYFKELAGCERTTETLADDATLGQLHEQVCARFPKLAAMRKSTLLAVGVEYQDRAYALREGDEVSLFPPVQGG
jgi:molybdopterin converting factor small subunit